MPDVARVPMIRAGACTDCGASTWRTVTLPATGDTTLLWPDPASVYPRYRQTNGSLVVGIGYCADCSPRVGDAAPACVCEQAPDALEVEMVESAPSRYVAWYAPEFRTWLTAWLVQQRFSDDDAQRVLARWHTDAAAAAARAAS